MERLDKLIAHLGHISRAEAHRLIRAGLVAVDGAPCRDIAAKWDPTAVTLALRGEVLRYQRHRYLALNKPAGVLSAARDEKAPTVLDLLSPAQRSRTLAPVGRLDKDTVGLLLLTDDGDFAHRLLSPRRHVPKRYCARLSEPLPSDTAARFAEGITLADDTHCLPATLVVHTAREVELTIFEGKYHQVRRMFAAAGSHVEWLQRTAIGALELDALRLAEGHARDLTAAELALLTSADFG